MTDLLRITPLLDATAILADQIRPHLLSLAQIEQRHRKSLAPIYTALVNAYSSGSALDSLALNTIIDQVKISREEGEAIKVAIELRVFSRAASDGAVIGVKQLTEEFERRE